MRRPHRSLVLLPLGLAACGSPLEAPQVEIQPADPTTVDELVAVATSADEGVAYSYTWYRNGGLIPSIAGDRVSPDDTTRDEVWKVEVVATSGLRDSEVGVASVTIVNAPPVGTVTLDPATSGSGIDLRAVTTGDDADGDAVSFRYAWEQDGTATRFHDEVLPGESTSSGQTWKVTATPTDGTDDGEPVTAEITLTNGVPRIRSAAFSPDPVTAADDAALALDVFEPDGDPVTLSYTWTLNGEDVGTVDTLPRSTFARGDTIAVTVTATDPSGGGDTVTLGPVAVANALPRPGRVRLTPTSAREASLMSCIAEDVRDADGDPTTVAYAWTVNGVPVAGAASTALDGAAFSRDDVVACLVTASDAQGAGPTVASSPVTIRNSPPVLAFVGLTPILLDGVTPISAVLGAAHDDDGDAITFTYQWYVENRPVATTPDLDASLFTLGDEVRCDVTPHDDREAGAAVSSRPTLVANTPPIVTAVAFVPAVPTADTGVQAVPTATDPNGDPFTYTFSWRVDGVRVDGVTGDVLDGAWIRRGAVIDVDVNGVDAGGTGPTFRSPAVVAGNGLPSITGATITPATVDETTVARCTPLGIDDPDGDTVQFDYAWTRNGVLLAATSATLAGTSFDKGDVIACTIVPDDGIDLGTPITSNGTTIGNAKPTLGRVTLSPTIAREATTFTVTWQGLTDPDAVDLAGLFVTYRWFVNGIEVVGATTNRLNGASFDKGDLVYVVATPNDAFTAGTPLTSDFVTISNTAPKVASIAFSPLSTTRPTVGDTLVATPTVDDPDADETYTFQYTWSVNGGNVKTGADPTLSAPAFRRDDRVKVTAIASDGTDAGPAFTSAEVVIKNSAPGAPGVRLSPRWATPQRDDLRCAVGVPAVDLDGDVLAYVVTWTRNGVAYPAAGDLGPFTRVLANDTVPAGDVDAGDSWVCSITASDGQRTGAAGTARSRATTFDLASVTTGLNYSCGVDATGEARCWGLNTDQQSRPPTATRYLRVAAGQAAACGVTTSKTLSCWGNIATPLAGQWDALDVGLAYGCASDANGTLACWGNSTNGKTVAPGGTGWQSLSIGLSHACAVNGSGIPTCWGDNSSGQRDVPAGSSFVQIAAGGLFTCGLGASGAITCWGQIAEPPAGAFVEIAAGAVHACAIDAADQVVCWGDGATVDLAVPPGDYARVAPGGLHTCGTRTDGTTVCWGRADEQQLQPPLLDVATLGVGWQHACAADALGDLTCWGQDDVGQAEVPPGLPPVIGLAAGRAHTCALLDDASLSCWGSAALDQVLAPVGGAWTTLDAGRDHTCALDDLGLATCWGDDGWGQSTVPAALAATPLLDIAGGEHHTCALALDTGKATCWGYGGLGETSPPADTAFLDVAVGQLHSCGVLRDGTLDCWGNDFYGQSTPPIHDTFTKVVTGQSHSCALTTAGLVRCWGTTQYGITSPPTTGTYVDLDAGWTHTCALRDDGRQVCWGKYAF